MWQAYVTKGTLSVFWSTEYNSYITHKKKKQVKDKGFLMSKYPHDPIIRGSFFKINKEYAKRRKYKKEQFRQQIIDKLDTFQSNNQKEYWNLVNSLRESKRDNP